MRSTGIGKDGGRGDRAQQGRVERGFVVGIVRFQSGEGVEVGETEDWFGGYNGGQKGKSGMREGGGCVERGNGVHKTSGGWWGRAIFWGEVKLLLGTYVMPLTLE
jgi:hypothetical protein